MTYTIGEMAKMLNIAPSALRFYDKKGLLPFVERSHGGKRLFQEKDFEWLQIIHCLKNTGMPLNDIRSFIEMAMKGDETIKPRLELFIKQRDFIKSQIAGLQETLDILEFKCWYYETADAAGTTSVPRNMALEDIPEHLQETRRKLQQLPFA